MRRHLSLLWMRAADWSGRHFSSTEPGIMGRMHLRTQGFLRHARATGLFMRQCLHELAGKTRRKSARNSDLRQHSFAAAPEPPQKARKRLSLKRFRNRLSQNRRVRKDTFETQLHTRPFRLRLLPLVFGALVVAFFTVFDGEKLVAGLFKEISVFKVRTLEIVGCESTSRERLRLLTGINMYQTSMLGLDATAVAASVEQDPWVSKAVVKRKWPSDVVIEVIEHQPVAMINKSSTNEPRLFYVDRTGTAFLEVVPGQDVDYPVITGLDRFTGEEERQAIFSEIYTFLKLAGRNNPNLPAQSVSEIHVNEQGEMVIYLVDHTFPIFFGKGNISTKYSRLVKVLDALYREKRKGMLISGVEYIRMDYLNDKVLVAQSESG